MEAPRERQTKADVRRQFSSAVGSITWCRSTSDIDSISIADEEKIEGKFPVMDISDVFNSGLASQCCGRTGRVIQSSELGRAANSLSGLTATLAVSSGCAAMIHNVNRGFRNNVNPKTQIRLKSPQDGALMCCFHAEQHASPTCRRCDNHSLANPQIGTVV